MPINKKSLKERFSENLRYLWHVLLRSYSAFLGPCKIWIAKE